MPDYGPHFSYILAAYLAAGIALVSLAAFSLAGRAAARRRLSSLEDDEGRP